MIRWEVPVLAEFQGKVFQSYAKHMHIAHPWEARATRKTTCANKLPFHFCFLAEGIKHAIHHRCQEVNWLRRRISNWHWRVRHGEDQGSTVCFCENLRNLMWQHGFLKDAFEHERNSHWVFFKEYIMDTTCFFNLHRSVHETSHSNEIN